MNNSFKSLFEMTPWVVKMTLLRRLNTLIMSKNYSLEVFILWFQAGLLSFCTVSPGYVCNLGSHL